MNFNDFLKSYDPPKNSWESLKAKLTQTSTEQIRLTSIRHQKTYITITTAAALFAAVFFIPNRPGSPTFAELVEKNDAVILYQLGWKKPPH